ncbi:Serpentine receptor class beta-16 [Caenorhabditis elegans]|uniref:Serpentine receptor class beta-16 n=1 Tax=Caenorhabditis elegans TaxID=6239 RepID=SRB16_CAEEL|nr:Serpentine receptor class beta-16 [Caenorhabditis elegans]Q20961.1 RecName: Full=Serpentine receptor class beta-16; Short=Protein srb-16 [Caenorhabditis elegans]CCD65837.1 Serpentine receptor class beta-16 [Caenorhabditis elegans]|eukprot:NP_494956.1 Serpentine Receptor, class B (beta) [Caenorhabditis elegans]
MDRELIEICKENSATAFSVGYQIVYLIYVVLSVTSIFTCSYFIKTFIWNSTFHPNFKLLLTMYFFAAIFHSFLFTASYLMMIERFLDYQTDCDIHVSMVPYAIVHSSIACCLFCGMLTQVFMVIERLLATIKIESYEHNTSFWHILAYLFFCIVLPLSLLVWAYQDADYNSPVITAISPPKGVEIRLNILYIFCFFLAILALILLQVVRFVNKRRESRIEISLSGRFQIVENIDTTTFISSILIINMIMSVIYIVGTFTLRNFQFDAFINNQPALATVKTIFYLHPLFSFLMPLISSYHLSKMRERRVKRREHLMAIKTKGREGSDAYNQLLHDQWTQHFLK